MWEVTVELLWPQATPEAVGPPTVVYVVVATIQPSTAVITGELDQVAVRHDARFRFFSVIGLEGCCKVVKG